MLAAAGMSACSKEETATAPAEAKYIQVTIPEDAVAGVAQAGNDVAVVIVCNTNINDLGDNYRNQKVKYDFQ